MDYSSALGTEFREVQDVEHEGKLRSNAQSPRESSERPDPALDDERRRYFALTDFGREVLEAELARFMNALDMARAKDLRPGHGTA